MDTIKGNLLLVDDDANLLELMRRHVVSAGHKAFSTTKGQQAVDKLNYEKFDILITDLVMPEMDGMQLLKHTKNYHPDTDVVVITGYVDEYTYIDVVNAGAADFINKPFSKDELLAKIQRIFQERILKRELHEKNIALKVLVEQLSETKRETEHNVRCSINELILPALKRLDDKTIEHEKKMLVNFIKSSLNDISSSFSRSLSLIYNEFTPQETRVAFMIKEGKSTKEIATLLDLSIRTVETYRENIRKKFGLTGQKTNLRSFLSSLSSYF